MVLGVKGSKCSIRGFFKNGSLGVIRISSEGVLGKSLCDFEEDQKKTLSWGLRKIEFLPFQIFVRGKETDQVRLKVRTIKKDDLKFFRED